MIIPSIDLMSGNAVQLIGGKKRAIDAGDPMPIARDFALCGEIAVVDLDHALGSGDNTEVIAQLCDLAPCRVGGGIRDVDSAVRWLDRGATSVVLGTAATPDVLRHLPRERIIAALDARDGEVVIEGWQRGTGAGILERMEELRPYVHGFLITIVEREGRMVGVDLEQAKQLAAAAGDCRITLAGGIRTPEEIAALDEIGVDAQVGMALYTGTFSVADALIAMLRSDRADGLWPTVVADESGRALGLAYSNADSVREAMRTHRGIYWSRSRHELWMKGDTSGNTQDLLRVDLDCDRDALRFTVRQSGPFCHLNTRTCWGNALGLAQLEATISSRHANAEPGSYTARLFNDGDLLASKLTEEARELAEANSPEHIAAEAADVLYFALVRMRAAGVALADVERELDRRALRITRRGGEAKPA